MSATANATLIIETLIGRTLTPQQLLNIGRRFKNKDPYGLGSYADPANPTAEELAQLFLDTVLKFAKDIVAQDAETVERKNINESLQPTSIQQRIQDAIDSAVGDLA